MNMINTRNRSSMRLPAILIGMGLLCFSGLSAVADPPTVQSSEGTTVQSSDRVAEQKATSNQEQEESLEVRYARAHLDLAKLDLKRAEYWNRQIPDVVSARTLDYLKKHVQIDAEQLRQTQQENYADVQQIYLAGAKAAVELAEADVARKQLSLKKTGGTYAALELDRAVAVLNVAKLNYERTASQQDSLQTISYLQWQLEELRNQILELQVKVESTPERVAGRRLGTDRSAG